MSTPSKIPRRLFGTDGIRGVANVEPMTSDLALLVGRAVAQICRRRTSRPKVVIGKDTRLSGYMFESALASGLVSAGADVALVGPLPTPAVAFLTRHLGADAGVVISASHNPYTDNGLKFFDADGFKLGDDAELQVEALVLEDGLDTSRPTGDGIGRVTRVEDAALLYGRYAKDVLSSGRPLEGLRIVADCANGAAYRVAPDVLTDLGASVIALGAKPDGVNINRDCGAVHPEILRDAVRRQQADVGLAFDGDADRMIFVDSEGAIVDGDETLAMLALDLQQRGKLRGSTVVTTIMSNVGLEIALRERGVALVRTPVGDRYVLDEMVRGGFNLGGEQSGHIVQLDLATTGDGLITALSVLRLMTAAGQPLCELKRVMTKLPQVLVNVPVSRRAELAEDSPIVAVVRRVERALGDRSRVVVRYSGTEPLLRVMVEGESDDRIRAAADEIVTAVQSHLG